jgi:hypothetical protein
MSQADLVIDIMENRSERPVSDFPTVLIEIPEIKRLPIAQDPRTIPRAARTVGRQPHRSRRRLRREVSLAGCALIALVPIISACTLGWSNRPDRILACAISDPLQSENATDNDGSNDSHPHTREGQQGQIAISSPQAVVLSIDPAAVAPRTTTEIPVIFPGYVLPDDSREDSLHEGS